jgi:hypothetical protein
LIGCPSRHGEKGAILHSQAFYDCLHSLRTELLGLLKCRVRMSCPACVLSMQVEFSAEMMLHFAGLKNLNKSPLFRVSIAYSAGRTDTDSDGV